MYKRQPGAEVEHDEHGRGWVWGSGLGVVTVRFETRRTGIGPVRSLRADDPALHLSLIHIFANKRPGLARAITLVESTLPAHRPLARELLAALLPHSGNAIRVGLTGVPGAGKSTFTDAMGVRLIDRGHKVAVLAVDPSSSRTGGSILGLSLIHI